MSSQGQQVGQTLPIFADEEVDVGFASTQGIVNNYTKKLQWDSQKLNLVSAVAHIDAKQTYGSGASLDIFMNDQKIATLNWQGFDTSEKMKDVDVSGLLIDGDNTFKLQYSTGYGVLTEQIATVNMGITIDLFGQTSGGSPFTTGDTTKNDFWKSIANNAKTIAIWGTVIIIGGALAFVVINNVTKGTSFMDMFKSAGGFVKSRIHL